MSLRQQPWPGMRQDVTDLGDGPLDVVNVKYRKQGELQRRPGLGTRYALSATQLGFLSSVGGNHLIGYDGTTLTSLNMDTGATTSLATGLTAVRGTFALANGALYYANGTDAVRVIYRGDQASVAAGIVAPASAPTAGTPAAGVVTAGVHLIRFRWKNSATGYYSNPSPALSFAAAGSENIPLTLGTTADAKVDKMVIEMTEVDGSTFYVVDTVNDGSAYTINIADSALNQQQLADVYAAPDGFGHEPPPSGLRVITSSRNRIFGLDATGTLYWSRAAYPEAFNVLEWSQRVFSNGGDKAVALGNFMSDIYVFGQRSMARLVYNGDPSSGMFAQMPTSFGVWNQNCVVEVEGSLWGWGRQGIFRITEIQPKFMSAPVATTLRTDPDVTAADAFFAFYDTQERVLWFCYKAIGDTGVRRAVCYDLQTREWHRRTLRHQINHAIIAGDATRDDYAYLADDDGGYTWRLEDDRFDGVPTSMPNGVITSDVGSSTTVINTLESVADVVGAILYDPSNGEERRITGSTASTVTLASALTNAPVVGSQYWIGSIPVMYRSQWVPVSYVYEGRRPSYLELLHLSTTSGVVMDVTYYVDYSATPTTWTRVADDAMMNGLTITNGATYATQDVSAGKNTVPVPADFSLTLQFKLDQAKPLGTFRLLNASFLWNDQRGAKEVGN
jgi:hypothetical protein